MKKLFLTPVLALIALIAIAAGPNEKVAAIFQKTFDQAKDISWFDVDNQYEASFKLNNITYRVLYDKEGNVVRSVRYYTGQNLPVIISNKLQKRFPGKTVFGVNEVSTEGDIIYHIIMQDEKSWIQVQSNSIGSLFIERKYKKA